MKNKITGKVHTLFLLYRAKTGSIVFNDFSIKGYYFDSYIVEVNNMIYRIVEEA